jgi:hypothetical protein
MNTSLRLLQQRFPEVGERVAAAFARDEDFRDLCADYEACVSVLGRLGEEANATEAMRREYSALLLRLERELLRSLEEQAGEAS